MGTMIFYLDFIKIMAGLTYAALNFFLILKLIMIVDLELGKHYFPYSGQVFFILGENLIHIAIIAIFVAFNALCLSLYNQLTANISF